MPPHVGGLQPAHDHEHVHVHDHVNGHPRWHACVPSCSGNLCLICSCTPNQERNYVQTYSILCVEEVLTHLYSKLPYEMGLDFLDIQYIVPGYYAPWR